MRRIIVSLLVGWSCCLAGLGAFGQARGPVRPAPKGVKIGGKGKDYIVLARPFVIGQQVAPGVRGLIALPGGVYRVKFEDDAGYYLAAPSRLGDKLQGVLSEYDGGLYVRKNKPDTFYIYAEDENGKIIPPDLQSKLPYDFTKVLRQ